jgi:hypothetical protein
MDMDMDMDDTYMNIVKNAYKDGKTRDNYLVRLKKLKMVCNDINYYEIISKPDVYYKLIRDEYPNHSTRKNMLTIILVLFKHSEALRKALPDKQLRWKKFHDDMDSFLEASYKKNIPNEKQLSRYTGFNEIEEKYVELKKGEDPHKDRATSFHIILLSLIVSVPPKRSDYASIKVYWDEDPHKTDSNYIVLNSGTKDPSFLVFNVYKTDHKYHSVTELIPRTLYRDIVESLRRHPREYLFESKNKKPFTSNDGFSKYLKSVFMKLFGKETGVTMLRHIYISEKIDFNEMNDEELEDISKQMMHSLKLQRKYKWNRNKLCEEYRKLCGDCSSAKKTELTNP